MSNIHKTDKTGNGTSSTSRKTVLKNPELGSAFVRIAHKIQSNNSKGQLLKINGKYFRVRELG